MRRSIGKWETRGVKGRYVGRFEIVPRGRRAKPHLATIRKSSTLFKNSLAANDADGMRRASARAWDALAATFEILRGEQDDGYLAGSYMQVPTGIFINDATAIEQNDMIGSARVDKAHPLCSPLSLREALNKIAHYKSFDATFRVDRRGAHDLVLGGSRNGRRWVAEILVSRLCRNASAAVAAIQWHP